LAVSSAEPATASTWRFRSRTTIGESNASAIVTGLVGVALRQPDSIFPISCSEMPIRSARARLVSPAFSRAQVTASGSWWSLLGLVREVIGRK